MRIKRLAHFTGHKDCIYALAPALKPDCFYTGAAEGYIVEWNYEKKGDGELLAQVPAPVYSLAAYAQQLWLLAGTARGNLHVIDITSKKELRNIEAHTQGLYHIHILQKHPWIITAGGDGVVRLWERYTLELVHTLHLSDKSARVIAVSPDETSFAVGYSDCHIRQWSLPDLQLIADWDAHENSIFSLTYTPDGKKIISGGRDVRLKEWALSPKPEQLQVINAHNLHINYLQYNPAGNLLASVSMDKTLKIWDGETLQLLKVIDKARHQGHVSSVNKVFWIDNNRLVTCSDDRTAMVWEIETE